MGYADLRRRREESGRDREDAAGLRQAAKHDPYLSIAAGLGIAPPVLWIWGQAPFDFWAWTLTLVPGAALVGRGVWLLFLRRRVGSPRTATAGREKQLLVAMADGGGRISPVQAALETSLTVDEAEEILSRLADRGHLLVESHDGALFYKMPNGRGGPGTR